MLIGIGGRKDSMDVVDLLLDCHERIRSFSSLALRLAEAEGVAEAEVREAAAKVRRYFTVALPRHVADEEESVAPRLLGQEPEVDLALRTMEDEHERHEATLRRVVEICATLSEAPGELPSLREELARNARHLCEEFETHLAREERIILPAMRRLLSAEALGEILHELRARRTDLT